MQLFQTAHGVARRDGDDLVVLAGEPSLHSMIVEGRTAAAREAAGERIIALSDAVLGAPVEPTRLIQVGLNYHSHLAEIGIPQPERMMFAVTEAGDSVNGPDASVTLPLDSEQVDHECEIAIVVGAPASKVSATDAWSVIAGLTACNDVSARDLQRAGLATGDRTAGKLLPGFKPLGPGLLTADDARPGVESGSLAITLTVNGTQRQHAAVTDMVFPIPAIIELVSAEVDLVPGDVIMTGSPAGVGFFVGRFLGDGDVVEITLGSLPPLRTNFVRSTDQRS
jgi:2-keto-4-pentenoate hydratase/2-oxohepta-3-ene-1,7-dioic acid hydratase in catechol pathway